MQRKERARLHVSYAVNRLQLPLSLRPLVYGKSLPVLTRLSTSYAYERGWVGLGVEAAAKGSQAPVPRQHLSSQDIRLLVAEEGALDMFTPSMLPSPQTSPHPKSTSTNLFSNILIFYIYTFIFYYKSIAYPHPFLAST